jgi:hypothetical protein
MDSKARHFTSFCSKESCALAGDEDGSTSVRNPAASNCGAKRPEVLPLKAMVRSAAKVALQNRKIRRLRIAYRRIKAAFPAAGIDYVPQANPVLREPGEPLRVGQRHKRIIEHCRQQSPELLARMRVILAGSE